MPAATGTGPDPVLERLTRLHPKIIDLSLGRVEALLARLGNPHRKLPPVVHVGGTNGKGSVVAYLRAMLEAAGQRVHVYTSPHLVRFNERVRLAGKLIDDDALVALLEECEAANQGEPITFFEITTAAAFLAFARQPADAVLLEVGLGGRLDATNLIARPAATAITPVSLDHQQYLGESLPEIAAEKAGILKPGRTCVLSAQPPEADAAIAACAREIGARLLREGREWKATRQDGALLFAMGETRLALPPPSLRGAHQAGNAGAALALAMVLRDEGFAIPDAALGRGLAWAEWPARMQRLVCGPLVARLPAGAELWLDGGHNPAAGEILAAEARAWAGEPNPLPLVLVVGMLNSKDPRGFFRPLAGLARAVRTVAIPGEANALPADALADVARDAGLAAKPMTDAAAALDDLLVGHKGPQRVLICGSLYLAGKVLAENG